MRIKVELHRDVVRFLRHDCDDDERLAFCRQLETVRSAPIENSECLRDPRLSRYMLRFFRFGQNMAVFKYDAGQDRIRVLECREIRPGRRKPKPGNGG